MNQLLQQIARDPNLLSAAVFGGSLLIVGLIAVVWLTLFQQDERRLRRRLERLHAGPRGGAHAAKSAEATLVETVRRNKRDSSIASIDRLMKRLLPNLGILRLRLARSGWPLKIGDFMLICLGLGAAAAIGLGLAFGLPIWINACLGVVVGVGLPNVLLQRRITQRIKKFTSLLPEALDLIVRGIRSGLPATEALKTIAEEIQDPVGTEFRLVTDQMKIGVAMDEAMWATAKRLAIPEFNFLVISLSIQQETGGNLAEILEKLSDMVRRREQMRLKIKAMSSEARASAMIIGSLPFIMAGVISFVNPGYMNTLFTDPRGWVMIAMGLTSLLVGLGVMSKMIKFDI
jgi:tight adherence protein B